MKIAGVVRENKRGASKRKGDAIELKPDEKTAYAVVDALVASAPEGQTFLTHRSKVTVNKFNFSPTDSPGKLTPKSKGFAQNSYSAEGTVSYQVNKLGVDKVYPEKLYKYQIKFCDCLDHMGMPELKVEEFNVVQ